MSSCRMGAGVVVGLGSATSSARPARFCGMIGSGKTRSSHAPSLSNVRASCTRKPHGRLTTDRRSPNIALSGLYILWNTLLQYGAENTNRARVPDCGSRLFTGCGTFLDSPTARWSQAAGTTQAGRQHMEPRIARCRLLRAETAEGPTKSNLLAYYKGLGERACSACLCAFDDSSLDEVNAHRFQV